MTTVQKIAYQTELTCGEVENEKLLDLWTKTRSILVNDRQLTVKDHRGVTVEIVDVVKVPKKKARR